ncbi:hypothetical protein M422DRAFT_46136 [Sphaerobolus stellatus SS14]|nr:hypothetical protein M422DRAFT_46136 [Sphaerobolus stellatus SS14]
MDNGSACEWGQSEPNFFKIKCTVSDPSVFFSIPESQLREPQFRWPEYSSFLTNKLPETLQIKSPADEYMRDLLTYMKNLEFNNNNVPPNHTPREIIADRPTHQKNVTTTRQSLKQIRLQQPLDLIVDGQLNGKCVDVAIFDEYLYQFNTHLRKERGVPELKSMIFPAIIWDGIGSTFYRIKITQELADAVTKVHMLSKLDMPIQRGYNLFPFDNRRYILKISENMKDFLPRSPKKAPIGWQRFMTNDELEGMERKDSDDSEIL